MKKFLAILLMFAMIFTFAACGGTQTDEPQTDDQQQNEDVQQDETPDAETLTETDQIALATGDGEWAAGQQINLGQNGVLTEVMYAGEMVTGYELLVEGDAWPVAG